MIESDAPLALLSASPHEAPALTITRGPVPPHSGALLHEAADYPGGPVLRVTLRADEARAQLSYGGWCALIGPDTITYTRLCARAGEDALPLSLVAERVLLPWWALLYGENILALHGAAVAIGDHALVVLGPSGVGKSSTVQALVARGGAVLTDDMVLVEVGDALRVRPTAPTLRLWSPPGDIQTTASLRIPGPTTKRWFQLAAHHATAEVHPLGVVVILCREVDPARAPVEGRASALPPMRALVEVLRHTFDVRAPDAQHAEAFRTARLTRARQLVERAAPIAWRFTPSSDQTPTHAAGLSAWFAAQRGRSCAEDG